MIDTSGTKKKNTSLAKGHRTELALTTGGRGGGVCEGAGENTRGCYVTSSDGEVCI